MADSNKRGEGATPSQLQGESVNTNKGELYGKFNNVVTSQSKSLIWDRIAKKT